MKSLTRLKNSLTNRQKPIFLIDNLYMNKKVVVGVSGGPDSMYLLYKLYKKNRVTPVVAHVNYNFREESVKETELVRNFCKQNNIELYVLEVTEELLKEYAQYNNKQQMARIIRYDFYKDVANKVKAKDIYLAHHKDDFIETAIMQEEKSKDLPFYGIDKVKTYEGFTIKRPLLKY
jgi:tRNA(Ile)-lysidine synthase